MGVKLRLMKRVSKAKLADATVRKEVWDAITDTALAIENDVKKGANAAPFKTGNLRRSYHVTFLQDELAALVGADQKIAPYAKHVEFGTKHMDARPHLRPAAAAQRDQFKQRIAAAMKKAGKKL